MVQAQAQAGDGGGGGGGGLTIFSVNAITIRRRIISPLTELVLLCLTAI